MVFLEFLWSQLRHLMHQDIEPCILHLYTFDLSIYRLVAELGSLRKHAGYHYLGCTHTFSPSSHRKCIGRIALSKHTGSPYMRGTRCWFLDSAAKLWNMSRVHLATGLAQAVLILSPRYAGRARSTSLLHVIACYCLLLRNSAYCGPPAKTHHQVFLMVQFCLHFVHNSINLYVIMKSPSIHHYHILIKHYHQVTNRYNENLLPHHM